MEVDLNYCNNNRKGGVFVPNQEKEFIPSSSSSSSSCLFPPPIYNSLKHSGLNYHNLGPFVPHFGPVNSGPFEFEMDPDHHLMEKEVQRSRSLVQFMAEERLVPSPEEEFKRKNITVKLKQIVMKWVKGVAHERQLPKNRIKAASATILTFGSYGLGVHNADSDMDAVCVAPYFATLAEDFFIGLYNILSSRPEVTDIHCIRDAKVPLMKFKFDGVSIDLPFAQLKVISVPEDVDLFNPFFLRNIDETSLRSLSGIHANKSILRLVPDIELFQSLLRCVKLWAKRRGVYGHLFGYFGGVHLAVLSAFICQRHPNASLSALISIFFKTFAYWPWPTPVCLDGRMVPPIFPTDVRFLMPIQLPCSPNQYCQCNITRSTFFRIREEFVRGYAVIEDILRPDFNWSSLFDPFPHPKSYVQFVKISLSFSDHDSLGQWVGWVKSRFRSLLVKLEDSLGFCDPNPNEYGDNSVQEPNVVFYWGLQTFREITDLENVHDEFLKSIRNGYQGPFGKMKLSVTKASQLPKNHTSSRTGSGFGGSSSSSSSYNNNSSNRGGGGGGGGKPHWRFLRKIPEPEKHLPGILTDNNNSIPGCETASLNSPRLQTVV